MKKKILSILCGIGGFAMTMLLLTGGHTLIRGIPFEDGLKDFWNWAIAAMAGFSFGYSLWIKGKGK